MDKIGFKSVLVHNCKPEAAREVLENKWSSQKGVKPGKVEDIFEFQKVDMPKHIERDMTFVKYKKRSDNNNNMDTRVARLFNSFGYDCLTSKELTDVPPCMGGSGKLLYHH